MVILIRLYAFYFGSPRRITYNTFKALRRFTYLYGIMTMYMAHYGVAVETELFLATFVVRMNFRNGFSSPFSQHWKCNASTFLQTLQFPGSAVSIGAWRTSGRVSPCTRISAATPLCMSVDPTSRGLNLWRRHHSRLIPFSPHTLPRYTRHVLIACV